MAWTVIGQSVMGTSHERRSQPCQDAWAWKEINGDPLGDQAGNHLCVAVADGAGSATHSDLGAKVAVATAVEQIAQRIAEISSKSKSKSESHKNLELEGWRSPLLDVLENVQTALNLTAQQQDITPRDLACTLLIMLWTPLGIATLQVGDGAIVGRDQTGQMVALTQPHQGEYANQTIFVVEDAAADNAQFVTWPFSSEPLSHVALFSDGLQRLALELPSGKPFSPFFDPLFGFLDQVKQTSMQGDAGETLEKFLRSPRVTARTDDDLTLVLIKNQD